MKLCADCITALGRPSGVLCLRCEREVRMRLTERGQKSQAQRWPKLWVPAAGEAVGVAGLTGMGKSEFEKALTAFIIEKGTPVYWWDAMREGSREGIARESTPLGPLRHQLTVKELEYLTSENLACVAEDARAPAIALVPNASKPKRAERAADFCRGMELFIEHKPKGPCVLFITECGLLEGDADAEELLGEMATTWRKEQVGLVFDLQMISQLPDRARRQLLTIVAFRQVDTFDRRRMKELVSKRYADAVSALPPRHCLLADRLNPQEWEDTADQAAAEDAA
jgi:hypothetical protein